MHTGEASTVIEPVESGDDGDPDIVRQNAGEIDHDVFVRLRPKEGFHHFRLPRGRNQQVGIAPGDHHHIAHGFDTRVFPDRANAAMRINRRARAGRIDQFMLVDAVEIFWDDLLQAMEKRGRVEGVPNGRVECRLRLPLRRSPPEQGHRTSSVIGGVSRVQTREELQEGEMAPMAGREI